MNPSGSPAPEDANDEVSTLIATLVETGQRLEELTAGEVDTVSDAAGRTFLLQRAQEQLRHSEAAKQAAILNALPAHIALLDAEGLIVSVNDTWRRFACDEGSQGPGSRVGLNYLDICDSAQGDGSVGAHKIAAGIRSVLDGAAKSFSSEYVCQSATVQHYFLLTVTPLSDDQPKGAIVMYLDVTTRRATENSLRESEARFRSTFEQAAAGMGYTTLEGRWVRVNQRLCDIVGYTREELLAQTYQTLTPPDDRDLDLVARDRLVAGEIQTLSREKRSIHKNGSIVWIDLTVSILRDESGEAKYFMAVVQDITSRKELEQELFHAQRMEGVGQLAGGIAHDFNNLLTVISGRSQLALDRMAPSDPLRREFDLIYKTSARAAGLTHQLLAFSRKQVLQPKVLDLNALIDGSIGLLKRLIGEDIELIFAPDSEAGRVRVDPGQLEQVIVNLAVNARDAMPEGGRLTIATTNVALPADYAAQHVDVIAGAHVMLTVSDTGVGMDRAVQARVFEPFFTTKGPGRGTGLGLATVYGIVKQSGGHIRISSEPGRGTTFEIYLQRTEALPEPPSVVTPGSLPTGTETVLVVEDETEVRTLACDVLETLGYTVLEAAGPNDAVLIAERHVGLIGLLLTDVVMPGMSGRALASRVIAERPETKVLYMSGYTDDAIARHGVLEPGTNLLEKPFTAQTLAVKLREVLDSPE